MSNGAHMVQVNPYTPLCTKLPSDASLKRNRSGNFTPDGRLEVKGSLPLNSLPWQNGAAWKLRKDF